MTDRVDEVHLETHFGAANQVIANSWNMIPILAADCGELSARGSRDV
ncbi:hypothetical protein LMG27174_05260 [Paraburkholderia rhynchosiae]|uniref:Uncharacterized protein n=1 Tax=Paraburkholderia rhynchosiae TaxID=487049 RepID=A0A6J5C2X8_9BURK|nr:hypothetical protein LMG27174_05260 [Paraburkholderia rhynchosiae]